MSWFEIPFLKAIPVNILEKMPPKIETDARGRRFYWGQTKAGKPKKVYVDSPKNAAPRQRAVNFAGDQLVQNKLVTRRKLRGLLRDVKRTTGIVRRNGPGRKLVPTMMNNVLPGTVQI